MKISRALFEEYMKQNYDSAARTQPTELIDLFVGPRDRQTAEQRLQTIANEIFDSLDSMSSEHVQECTMKITLGPSSRDADDCQFVLGFLQSVYNCEVLDVSQEGRPAKRPRLEEAQLQMLYPYQR